MGIGHEHGDTPVDVDTDADPGPVDPTEIDESYAPRRSDDLVTVEIEGELVVVGGPWSQAQLLNPTAAMLWQCFDGETTLGALIDDISDELAADRAVVADDVLAFARTCAYAGYLADIVQRGQEYVGAPTARVNLDPGTTLEPFTAADLDGTTQSFGGAADRKAYLVNWNPGCGFCDGIAASLADLEPPLALAGYDLVLVAAGDVGANRALVERAGLRARVLLPAPGANPFGVLGTPAAVAVDDKGVVTHPLATGAFDVPGLAAALAGVDLPTEDDADHSARYLPVSGGMCGAGAVPSGPKTTWIGTQALRFGAVHVGVQVNNAWTADVLERLFPSARVEDEQVPANYSVALTDPSAPSRDLQLLVAGTTQRVRSRSRRRVLVGLLNHVSASLATPRASLLRVDATAAIDRAGRAHVLPADVMGTLAGLQPRLAAAGLALVDVPHVVVDPSQAAVVVPEPSVEHDAVVLDEVDGDEPLGRGELTAVGPGLYPIAGWYVFATETGDPSLPRAGDALRAALAVASVVSVALTDDIESAITSIRRLVDQVPVIAIPDTTAADIAAAVASATGIA